MNTTIESPVIFTETEKKLLRLTLCSSAHPGEVDGAGRALIAGESAASIQTPCSEAQRLVRWLLPNLPTSKPS